MVTTKEERPDIRELVGVAVNTSGLALKEGQEGALDRVAALGAAAMEIASGGDLQGLPVAAMQPEVYRRSMSMADLMLDPGTSDARDVLAAELGPLLWHIRYGGQHENLPRAARLYTTWLRTRRLFAELADQAHAEQLERFTARVLHEWLSDRCAPCGGSGKLERSKTGSWIRPRGSMQRNATFRVCPACNGTRRAMPSHAERARWLGLAFADYEKNRWQQRFSAALIWLKQFHSGRVHRPLTLQLERRKRRR